MRKTFLLAFFCLTFSAFSQIGSGTVSDFLSSLTQKQKDQLILDFNNESRYDWHYLPWTMFERKGIPLKDLRPDQRELLHSILKAYLSESGYQKTTEIIDLENVLAASSGDPTYRDPLRYYLAVYGDPENEDVWMWTFQGHHVALQVTTVAGEISYTPRFFGSNPGRIMEGDRKGFSPLAKEEDLGLKLINALPEEQRSVAIFNERAYNDIVTANRSEITRVSNEGLSLNDMKEEHRKMAMDIIYQYLSDIPSEIAMKQIGKIRTEELDDLIFGWAGATALGKAHYYRIQGKSFILEFDNAQNNANHIHTVWRDFEGDYGRDLLKEHYTTADHPH